MVDAAPVCVDLLSIAKPAKRFQRIRLIGKGLSSPTETRNFAAIDGKMVNLKPRIAGLQKVRQGVGSADSGAPSVVNLVAKAVAALRS